MGKNSDLLNINKIIEEILSIENFDLSVYFDYVKKYGEKIIAKVFNEILLVNKDNDNILNKYFDAYFYIELEQITIEDDTYLNLISKYGEDTVNNFFNELINVHENVEVVKKKYSKIYFYIESLNDANKNSFNLSSDIDYVDSVKCYLKEIISYDLLGLDEEKMLLKELFSLRKKIEIVYFDEDDNIIFYNVYDIVNSINNKEQFRNIKKILKKLSNNDKKVVEQYVSKMKKEFKDNERINIYNEVVYDEEYLNEQLKFLERFIYVRDKIINANLRLVVSIAKRHVVRGVDILDLISEGNIGLMRAIKKFDLSKNVKISTYATWWIKQAVSRYIADNSKTIRIPVHYNLKINKYMSTVKKLTQMYGSVPSDKMVAEYLDMSLNDVEDIKNVIYNNYCFSLDYCLGEDEDNAVIDVMADEETTEDIYFNKELREIINECLSELRPQEIDVLKYRFGFYGGRIYKLEEVGKIYGVTRERIRQIESKALRKLKNPSRSKKFNGYY